MSRLRRITTGALALAAGMSVATATATAATPTAPSTASSTTARADLGMVFALTNDPAGNAVVAYSRTSGGMLHQQRSYATGGRGATLMGAVVDRTASAGALAADRSHSRLYAVNPGSDTLTVFSTAPGWLRRAQVIGTRGDFPVSVAVSPDGMQVVVLNARNGGSIQSFRMADGRLVADRDGRRMLHLPTMEGTNDEATHSPGQVAFTPDGKHVVVTTKASTNSLLVWSVMNHKLSPSARTHAVPAAVPFAVAFDRMGRMSVVNAGTNTVNTYDVAADGRLRQLGSAATRGMASCWIAAFDDLVISSNTGSNTLTRFRSTMNGPMRIGMTTTGMAPVDATFSRYGKYFFVENGATNRIETYRVSATGTLTRMDSDALPGPAGSEGIIAW